MKLIYGKGINDAKYNVKVWETIGRVNGKQRQKLVWLCPYYLKWYNMMARCYSKKYQDTYPSYVNCIVCEDWLLFSNFKVWMEKQDWEGKSLDKDLLFDGNKLYSPDNCVFISKRLNSFMTERKQGEFPVGVSWDVNKDKFVAQVRNIFTDKTERLGYFEEADTAHKVWLARKLELAKLLAAEQDDPTVAEALVRRYENYEISQV